MRILALQRAVGRWMELQVLAAEQSEQNLVLGSFVFGVIFKTRTLEVLRGMNLPVTGRRRLILLVKLLRDRIAKVRESAVVVPERLETIAQRMLRLGIIDVVVGVIEGADRFEGRALSGAAQHLGRWIERGEAGVLRHGARGVQRLPGECKRFCGGEPGRHRS